MARLRKHFPRLYSRRTAPCRDMRSGRVIRQWVSWHHWVTEEWRTGPDGVRRMVFEDTCTVCGKKREALVW